MKRPLLPWFLASLLVGLLSFILYSRNASAPVLGNDSYQYLDAAAHLASGTCLCTGVAHFDEQVRWARIPIPFTHFGPGFPVAIAALRLLGVPGETGGYLLSAAGYLLVICLIWLTCFYLEIPPWAIALISLLWSLNSVALEFGVSLATDCLFTAIVTGICALLAYDIRNLARPRPLLLVLLGALVGSAYWLRQPGLFLLFPLCLYLAWRCRKDRRGTDRRRMAPAAVANAAAVPNVHRRPWPYALAALTLASLMIAPVIIRNILFAHSWNSGFANGRHTPWKEVLSDTLKAPYHILFGTASVARFDLWSALFFLSALVLVWRALTNRRQGLASAHLPDVSRTILIWLLVFAGAFTVEILAAELSTYAANEVRYNFPVFPIVLIACGVLFQFASDRIGRIAALVCVLSIVMINARSLFAERLPPQSSVPAHLLQQQVQPGLSIGTYIQAKLPPDAILVATDGQAVYYLLKRPVVSIIEPEYTIHTWDEADVKSVMRSFGAQYFLVFPGAGKVSVPEQEATPFLHALTAGHPPSWLRVVARTEGVILYGCADCSKSLPRAS